MFWPSFNAALAVGAAQQRAVLNTTLSLCGCTLMVFVFSQLIRGKFKMVHPCPSPPVPRLLLSSSHCAA